MIDGLFDFEEGKMPLAVSLSTVGLILVFALGIVYRLLSFVAF